MAALMAHALTDGLGVAAQGAHSRPRALVIPLTPRSHSVATVVDEVVSMARASTGCVCVVAWAAPHPPLPELIVPLVAP